MFKLLKPNIEWARIGFRNTLPKKVSWAWKSINNAKYFNLNLACKLVSNGEAYVPGRTHRSLIYQTSNRCQRQLNAHCCLIVSHLLEPNGLSWGDEKLNTLFDEQSAKAIRSQPFRAGLIEDHWIQVKSPSGNFSVKSAYWLHSGSSIIERVDGIWAKMWKLNIHERMKMTLQRIAANILPIRDKLHRFNSQVSQLCPLCESEVESPMHIFILYDFARALWFTSNQRIRANQLGFSSTTQLIDFLISPPMIEIQSQQERSSFLLYGTLVLEAIWKIRNSVVFE